MSCSTVSRVHAVPSWKWAAHSPHADLCRRRGGHRLSGLRDPAGHGHRGAQPRGVAAADCPSWPSWKALSDQGDSPHRPRTRRRSARGSKRSAASAPTRAGCGRACTRCCAGWPSSGRLPRITPRRRRLQPGVGAATGCRPAPSTWRRSTGPIEIRPARAGDAFTPLGEPDSTEEPRPGEVVYAIGSEVLTRHWNYRDSERTKVDRELHRDRLSCWNGSRPRRPSSAAVAEAGEQLVRPAGAVRRAGRRAVADRRVELGGADRLAQPACSHSAWQLAGQGRANSAGFSRSAR